jgi:hypothetical protein
MGGPNNELSCSVSVVDLEPVIIVRRVSVRRNARAGTFTWALREHPNSQPRNRHMYIYSPPTVGSLISRYTRLSKAPRHQDRMHISTFDIIQNPSQAIQKPLKTL